MATRYGVRGSRELASAFRQLAAVPTAAARRRAREAALEPVKEAYVQNLRANDSDDTGALIASIGTGPQSGKPDRTLVGAREGRFKGRTPSSYSHFPEYGTAPHYQPNRFGGIWHPGARPKPALRPALESSVSTAATTYFQTIGSEIEAAARRIAARRGSR
jgi:hypothetical protein